MPRDFARRQTSNGRKSRSKPKRKSAVSPKNRVLFHGPSFSFGAIVGAALIIVAAYAPEWLQVPQTDITNQQVPAATTPTVEFEFPRILKESEVKADPSAYPVPEQSPDEPPRAFNIQAASFQAADDAHSLRAQLLLRNLPAAVDSRLVDGQLWFRVKVGPFDNKTLADRAMTQMREMYLTPIWMN
ncbi:MAG: SPOR domain-containing protein [Pseudomonadales bacterium]